MRRFYFFLGLLLIAALWMGVRSSTISMPEVFSRLLGIEPAGPVRGRAIEVDSDPVRSAGRRLLQPLGFVKVIRILPDHSDQQH